MTSAFFAFLLTLATPVQPSGSSPTAATEPSPVSSATIPTPVPWEFLVGTQHWDGRGNVGFGFSKGIHEIRLLGPNTGPYLDYKASLLHIKNIRFNAGGLIGFPSLIGGHVGVQYRKSGSSLWSRIAFGADGGVSCSRVRTAPDCNSSAGINLGFYFTPWNFEDL